MLKFGDKTFQDPAEITIEWGNYFKSLYSPPVQNSFDKTVLNSMQSIKAELERNDFMYSREYIDTQEVSAALRVCNKNKACGADGVYYEHLVHGGETLLTVLSNLYSGMFLNSYTPNGMKEGIIVTLHKGGNKSKTDPNNYRAITLSSCILKVYERILLNRIQSDTNFTLCSLQGGFQKGMGCTQTSYLLSECIAFAKENKSKLYVCILDAQKAFDTVWHAGLFYKLYHKGLDKVILKSLMSMYEGMRSCIMCEGFTSPWFPVLQGTRQGGVISPFLYLVFIDGLLGQLKESPARFKLATVNCSCPTVADDMVLISLSKNGLAQLMSVSYVYSCNWRYRYNATKCSVVVFNETSREYAKSKRVWRLGANFVNESVSYCHLGIAFNKYGKTVDNVKLICKRIKSTYLSLANSGILADGLHPYTSLKMYRSIVLPKALYGSEMLCSMTDTDVLKIERYHRFCIKYMQRLPSRSRTAIILGLLGQSPIHFNIDKRKHILFG